MADLLTCEFCFDHTEDLSPSGPACGKPATQIIHWVDGRWSPACDQHGYCALDQLAKGLVARVILADYHERERILWDYIDGLTGAVTIDFGIGTPCQGVPRITEDEWKRRCAAVEEMRKERGPWPR